MKIKASVEIINSKSDIYCNRYWAMILTDNESGRTAQGLIIGDRSNIITAMNIMYNNQVKFYESELPIRKFNYLTKEFAILGCSANDIIINCKKQLALL